MALILNKIILVLSTLLGWYAWVGVDARSAYDIGSLYSQVFLSK